jgi:phosphatidylinositol alpha-mannosyltransferase
VITAADGAVREDGVVTAGRPIAVPYQGTVAPIAPNPLAAAMIRRALRAFGPDVLHVHEPLVPSTALFATLAAPPSMPVVATFHAFAERSALLSAAAPLLRRAWRRLDVRLAVSEAAATFVRSRFAGPVRVVPNGCEVERFAEGGASPDLPAGRRITWVARLDRQKGFGVALRALESLLADVPDVLLVVAGDGRDRVAADRLPAHVRARVVLLGAVPNEGLPRYLSGSGAFVAPAVGQESFGLTLVEAMAAGVPVVASDIPGYREVVQDEVEGLLVAPNDPGVLAYALRRVLLDEALADRLRRAGRARAGRFSWRVVGGEIEEAYEAAARREACL